MAAIGVRGRSESSSSRHLSLRQLEEGVMEIEAWKPTKRIDINVDLQLADYTGSGLEYKMPEWVVLSEV